MKDKQIRCAVLGATGMVGQTFLWMLDDHPWFQTACAIASDARHGKKFADSATWLLPVEQPAAVGELRLERYNTDALEKAGVEIVFSALPAGRAREIEDDLRQRGLMVFSNASAYRYEDDVPVLIPEVNPEALQWIEKQGYPDSGFIITNSNCTTAGLAVALAPLRKFGIETVHLATYQAISGAGYPGLSALDIMGNTIPYIASEEEKVAKESCKILGINADFYSTCVRVPVQYGHLEAVWLDFEQQVSTRDVHKAWSEFSYAGERLPSLPKQPIIYDDNPATPQSRQSFLGDPPGMQVFTGRLRKQGNKIGFVLLSNNIVRGAAGGSIANAEAFVQSYAS